jgi:mRNA-degrading endonuclease RelE of RelBE toxin-antitoxin system
MKIYQSPTFLKFVKKVEKKFEKEIDKQIKSISGNPEIGEAKNGDLSEIRVHKFKFSGCLYLIAYRILDEDFELVMISTHENFYKDLKKFIKK